MGLDTKCHRCHHGVQQSIYQAVRPQEPHDSLLRSCSMFKTNRLCVFEDPYYCCSQRVYFGVTDFPSVGKPLKVSRGTYRKNESHI